MVADPEKANLSPLLWKNTEGEEGLVSKLAGGNVNRQREECVEGTCEVVNAMSQSIGVDGERRVNVRVCLVVGHPPFEG